MGANRKLFPPKPPAASPKGANSIESLKETNKKEKNGNIIVYGDDRKFHVVTRAMWSSAATVPDTDAGFPTLNQLVSAGVYLAELPDSVGSGIGDICTLVNLSYILQDE